MGGRSHLTLMSANGRTLARGVELVGRLEGRGVRARLMGGAGIFIRTPELHRWYASVGRTVHDLDMVCRGEDRRSVAGIMLELGYAENERLNRVHGRRRQVFSVDDAEEPLEIDVFFDELPMCHLLDLRGRLDAELTTLWPADLLLSKLQIVELDRKDLLDAAALLASCRLDADDGVQAIGGRRIADMVGGDWGWYHTLEVNLAKVRAHLPGLALAEGLVDLVSERIAELEALLVSAPKSVRWRARARIGERVRWYQPVEDLTR